MTPALHRRGVAFAEPWLLRNSVLGADRRAVRATMVPRRRWSADALAVTDAQHLVDPERPMKGRAKPLASDRSVFLYEHGGRRQVASTHGLVPWHRAQAYGRRGHLAMATGIEGTRMVSTR